jgi:hypothetical protein
MLLVRSPGSGGKGASLCRFWRGSAASSRLEGNVVSESWQYQEVSDKSTTQINNSKKYKKTKNHI